MVPVKLKMQAFLPFNDEQVIDFSVIENDKIFLITGNTGAGKTAVFDAIFFALYGHASGSQRENDSFKSKFSDDSVTSYVEFTFKNKGELYTVYRTPIQTKLRRNGNISLEKASAALTLENGEIISGVRNVDEYLESIIGLNAEQFKKIVMLPQGEFRRFLSDNSNDKQEILRKIFSTYIFEEFTQSLQEKNKELLGKVQTANTLRNSLCEGIIALPDSSLSEELSSENKNYEKIVSLCEEYLLILNEEADKYNKEISKLTEEKFSLNIEKFKETNKKLALLDKIKIDYALLCGQKAEFNKKAKELSLLERAREIHIVYENLSDTAKKLNVETEKQPSLEKEYTLSQADYDKKLSLFNSTDKIAEEIAKLQAMSETFGDLNAQNKSLEEINFKLTASQKYYNAFKKNEENKTVKTALSIISSLEAALLKRDEYIDIFNSASEQYQQAFNIFIANQAYNLACALKEDMPCPVCGSKTHPSPAVNKVSEHIDEKTLNDLKSAYEISVTNLQNSKHEINSIIFRLNEYVSVDENISVKDIAVIKSQFLSKLIPETEILPQNDTYSSLDNDGFNALFAKLNADKANVINAISALNEKINVYSLTPLQVKNQIKTKSELIEKIKADFNTASRNMQDNKTLLENNKQSIKQLKASHQELSSKLKNMLNKNNIDENTLPSLFEKINLIDKIKEEISTYNNSLIRCEEQIKAYSKELDGKEFTDIDKMQLKLDTVNKSLEEAKQKYEQNLSIISTDTKIITDIKKINSQFNKLSDIYNQTNELYQIASGKNKDKVSFERYVLGAYFDSVIENANIRLTMITDGRYYLRRRTDKERGNSPSGLDLEIFDSYNGKFRHVNTLSGGESFKTALCLALGLADTVTQNSGGIEISTIFIDEGFGTLDSDALDSAIECLYSIKASGRYIGIISHVSELCEKIPLKLYVSQGKKGSFASF